MTDPKPFHGFVGQRRAVRLLQAQAAGARQSGRLMPHVLLLGSAGMGKTELARAVAADMGAGFHPVVADRDLDIPSTLSEVQSHDILFIDEAHALPRRSQEALYGFMEAASRKELHKCDCPVSTVILATDQPQLLTKALLSRCPLHVPLTAYSQEEMRQIIKVIAHAEELVLTGQAVTLLAASSQGNPRTARQRIHNLAGFVDIPQKIQVDESDVRRFLETHGVDQHHRNAIQQDYLATLSRFPGAASLETIALQMGHVPEFIAGHVEPFLIAQCWVEITPKGRLMTAAGRGSIIGGSNPVAEA